MEAGRKLDALIAERLGWADCDPKAKSASWQFTDPPDPPVLVGIGYNPKRKGLDVFPDYSTLIAAAWPLLDKLGFILGPRFLGGWGQRGAERTGWYIYKGWVEAEVDTYEESCHAFAEADTAPLAIVKAFLKATEK